MDETRIFCPDFGPVTPPRADGERRRPSGHPAAARGERGNAAVEFALVAPILLVLILGTILFGLYFGVAHSVQQLASEAARAAVPGLTSAERTALATAFVDRAIQSYSLLRRNALTVWAAPDAGDPNLFTVSLTYDASGLGLNLFSTLLPSPPERVERRASVRRGGA